MTNELIDDEYIYQLHTQLKLMKAQRKQFEKDNLLLNGRLQCLKNEHAKTLKKIELTKKKKKHRIKKMKKKISKLNQKIIFKNKK